MFGSERCDCGDQIRQSLKLIDAEGRGVLVYMHQEGRGIGLTNKIKAYALTGPGTGYRGSESGVGLQGGSQGLRRRRPDVARISASEQIRLLTNNPRKISGLESYGLDVVERVPLEIPPVETNLQYLRTKQSKLGHLFTNLDAKTAKS